MILKCSVEDQISNKKVKAIYTELRRSITYSPGLDNVLAVVKIHIFDLLLVGGFSLVSLEDSHGIFNLALQSFGILQHMKSISSSMQVVFPTFGNILPILVPDPAGLLIAPLPCLLPDNYHYYYSCLTFNLTF